MPAVTIDTDDRVNAVFTRYPKYARIKMSRLRALVLEVAEQDDSITKLNETLKWGEPSYIAPKGSTLRMDWKEKTPDQYAMYFSCSSQLVPTFRAVYGDLLKFEGNRAIVFQLDEDLPITELKRCISAALNYHKVKHLPLLGM